MGIALSLPVIIGIQLGYVQIAIVITVGALLASPSDTSGNIKHKFFGILSSLVLAVLMSLIGGSLQHLTWMKLPIIGILFFAISYISVFGFRASLVSFSGLFALILSFSPVSGSMPTTERALLIGIGGLWYLLMTIVWHFIFPRVPTEFYLSKTLKLTAEYLSIRGRLPVKESREENFKKLLTVQTELTETHETLRSILISTRTGANRSAYERKRLLIFALLVDMLELAMANPVNYGKTDVFFKKNPQYLLDFQHLLFEMSRRLEELASNLSRPKRLPKTSRIKEFLKQVEEDILTLSQSAELRQEDITMLKNLYKYQREQAQKIEKIEWFLFGSASAQVPYIKNDDARNLLTKENYDLNVLTENLHFESPIFKHSLRMAVITIVGYTIGELFEVQNSYWILLTIIVIMRPTFGLTKQRSKHRTVGTLIGGALAVLVVLLVQNPWIYGILAIITLVVSFSMVQRNYKMAAVFITLSVVFSYALLTPDIFDVIQYRVTDTVIGTGLAIIGNMFLWPAWEIHSIQKTLADTTAANRKYFLAIVKLYKDHNDTDRNIKIVRKKAFTEMSNLSAAFQRMTQEPQAQQRNLEQVYELVAISHTFLSSLASLISYINNHPTTPASENFSRVSQAINDNLLLSEKLLNGVHIPVPTTKEADIFDLTYGRNISIKNITFPDVENRSDLMEEAHLIVEQLKWLLAMSEKMPKLIRKLPIG